MGPSKPAETALTRIVTYRRVSTDEQADSGLGLDAQAATIAKTIHVRNWIVVDELVDAGISGSTPPSARPALTQALNMLAAGEADTLIVAKLDRATQMAGVFSELERKMIAQRTSDALQALKANGQRLGRPIELPDHVRQRIADERAEGRSLRLIAQRLTSDAIPTARGRTWHASTVKAVLDSVACDDPG